MFFSVILDSYWIVFNIQILKILILRSRCKNRKGCINYYKDAVGSSGCFFNFLSLTSALCCALDVKPLDESNEDEKLEENRYYPNTRYVSNAICSILVILNYQIGHLQKQLLH